jgi:hypothetical protein
MAQAFSNGPSFAAIVEQFPAILMNAWIFANKLAMNVDEVLAKTGLVLQDWFVVAEKIKTLSKPVVQNTVIYVL